MPEPFCPDYQRQARADQHFQTHLRGQTFTLRSTWGLFSPRDIDEGTALLLRWVQVPATARCIDLGCGYGPIGLTLAKLAPQGHVVMLDKDFVAVGYANANARDNAINNAEAQLSNGFSALHGTQHTGAYDLIPSNLPAKVGRDMLYIMLDDARRLLRPGGRLYVVSINGLRQFLKHACQTAFGNYDKLKQGRAYTVAMAQQPEATAPRPAPQPLPPNPLHLP